MILLVLLFGGVASAQATEKRGGFCGEPSGVAYDFVDCFEGTCECASVAAGCKHASHAARHCGNQKLKTSAKVARAECESDSECKKEIKEWLKEALAELRDETKAATAFCDDWKQECVESCSE